MVLLTAKSISEKNSFFENKNGHSAPIQISGKSLCDYTISQIILSQAIFDCYDLVIA
jgi:hypothetical protein